MPDLTIFQWFILLSSGFFVGFTKTTGTALSSIIIPIMTDTFSARESTGILCLGFFIASIQAIRHYRHHINWGHFLKLAPGTLVGLSIGALFMQYIDDNIIRLTIGIIILAMLLFNLGRGHYTSFFEQCRISKIFILFCGVLIGFTSIVANAASCNGYLPYFTKREEINLYWYTRHFFLLCRCDQNSNEYLELRDYL